MRLTKNQKGFTLIEVIVVAVIIAVLSAVAIPLYNGYLTDSRRNTAENVAGSAASFIGSHVAMSSNNNTDSVTVSVDGAAGKTISPTTWIYSTNSQRTELIGKTTNGNINRFVIPTDIGIRINTDSNTVVGVHVATCNGNVQLNAKAPNITQTYKYH